jgi:hypothetical protein
VTRRPHFIVQDSIARGVDAGPLAAKMSGRITMLEGDPRGRSLLDLEQDIVAHNEKAIVFCSIPVSGWIRRNTTALARGIDLPQDFLRYSVYTTELDPSCLLNPKGLYLPWGQIPRSLDLIEHVCGAHAFIRPDSSLKPFPGFDVPIKNLEFEHHCRSQTDRVDASEMCFIAPAQDMPDIEYRTWIVESEVCAGAAYSWLPRRLSGRTEVPGLVHAAASKIARALEMREQCFTADFTIIKGEVKLVELNALSTSGWYEGADILSVFQAAEMNFI